VANESASAEMEPVNDNVSMTSSQQRAWKVLLKIVFKNFSTHFYSF
jgi:hypothetical protein